MRDKIKCTEFRSIPRAHRSAAHLDLKDTAAFGAEKDGSQDGDRADNQNSERTRNDCKSPIVDEHNTTGSSPRHPKGIPVTSDNDVNHGVETSRPCRAGQLRGSAHDPTVEMDKQPTMVGGVDAGSGSTRMGREVILGT